MAREVWTKDYKNLQFGIAMYLLVASKYEDNLLELIPDDIHLWEETKAYLKEKGKI
jgi:hypothetical protein